MGCIYPLFGDYMGYKILTPIPSILSTTHFALSHWNPGKTTWKPLFCSRTHLLPTDCVYTIVTIPPKKRVKSIRILDSQHFWLRANLKTPPIPITSTRNPMKSVLNHLQPRSNLIKITLSQVAGPLKSQSTPLKSQSIFLKSPSAPTKSCIFKNLLDAMT